jgi:spermidine synthase
MQVHVFYVVRTGLPSGPVAGGGGSLTKGRILRIVVSTGPGCPRGGDSVTGMIPAKLANQSPRQHKGHYPMIRPTPLSFATRGQGFAYWFPVCLALFLAWTSVAVGQSRLLYEKESPYNTIFVTEDSRGLRTLQFERYGARQSVVKVGDPDHIELPYVRSMLVGLAQVQQPTRVLVIGLGGGTLPMFLHKHFPQATIDAVDIDPGVIEVAKEFFGFEVNDRLRAHVADGRQFIEETVEPYDLILLDAYGSDSIPYHLATLEFLEATRRALAPGGLVVSNIWGSGSNPLYHSMVLTYRDVFAWVQLLGVVNAENIIILAAPRPESTRPGEWVRRARAISREKSFPFDLGAVARAGFQNEPGPTAGGRILRDGSR